MAINEIKVFYSWQSDLPGNQTKNLIQGSIDSAVKALRNTAEIIADRDTKNVLGTPDVTETIFQKIADSDIFVADISIINKYSTFDNEGNIVDVVKYSPNPNVLVELGFAAAVLGWEHIICIINTDFGCIEDLPFDLEHRRPFAYSLNKTDKVTVKKDICRVIMTAVEDVLENGPRARTGYSNLLVGAYDFEQENLSIHTLPPQSVENLPGFNAAKNSLIDNGRALVRAILDYPTLSREDRALIYTENIDVNRSIAINRSIIDNFSAPKPVIIAKEKRQEIKECIKKLFDIDVPESFFDFGYLQKRSP